MFKLQPGDTFLTPNSKWLQPIIIPVQKFWSKDNKAKYGHAGIITDTAGDTYEALWRVKSRNIWKEYAGKSVLIARHDDMTHNTANIALGRLKKEHDKDFYPIYRFCFFMFPPLAKIKSEKLVCSELCAKFLWLCGLIDYYHGCSPDDLHDIFKAHRKWKIIFEGKLPKRNGPH